MGIPVRWSRIGTIARKSFVNDVLAQKSVNDVVALNIYSLPLPKYNVREKSIMSEGMKGEDELMAQMKPVKVLIAEDDPMVLSLHVQALSQMEGFEIAGTVSDGQQLVDFFDGSSADLIIMDIYMPGMNGLEALRILRENEQNADVILVSAGKKGDIVNTARMLGAFDYMIKPYSF